VNPAIAKGKVGSFEISDNQYGRKRKIWVYLPAGYSASSTDTYPLVISFDGQDYLNDIPAPTILDNLIAAKKISPTVQIFVDNSEDRLGDLANHQKFADFLAKDLIPSIRKNYHVTTKADETIVCGYSAGGLGAAYVAYRYPSLFGKVLSQSGAYWRGNEGSSSGPEWLTSRYESSPKLGIKFYIVVGGAETMKNASGKSMIETNRHLRDVLLARGYEIGYLEAPGGGHMPESWRTQLAAGLIFLQSKH
jgi:enterochelin esterase family protein